MAVHSYAFHAVADPTRRQIIAVLGGGERQVNDVVAELDAWLTTFRHLWDARLDRLGKALAKKQRARTHTPDKETSR